MLCTFVTAFIAEEENKKRQNPTSIVFYSSQVNHFKCDNLTEFLKPKLMINDHRFGSNDSQEKYFVRTTKLSYQSFVQFEVRKALH